MYNAHTATEMHLSIWNEWRGLYNAHISAEHSLLMLCNTQTHAYTEMSSGTETVRDRQWEISTTQQKLKISPTYRHHKETANSGLIETMVSDYNLFTILMYFLWVFMPWLYALQLMICLCVCVCKSVCICAASDSICICVEAWIEINANSRRLSNFDLILFFFFIYFQFNVLFVEHNCLENVFT